MRKAVTENDFKAEILENQVVIAHVPDGHIFRFPILSNGTISLHGALIEPNPASKREARRFLPEAYVVARFAFQSAGKR